MQWPKEKGQRPTNITQKTKDRACTMQHHSMGTCAAQLTCLRKVCGHVTVFDTGNNKITELRTILQRESQNS